MKKYAEKCEILHKNRAFWLNNAENAPKSEDFRRKLAILCCFLPYFNEKRRKSGKISGIVDLKKFLCYNKENRRDEEKFQHLYLENETKST